MVNLKDKDIKCRNFRFICLTSDGIYILSVGKCESMKLGEEKITSQRLSELSLKISLQATLVHTIA